MVSHFNLSVLANETLLVSLSREIDNVFGAVGTCFDHVLSNFSGFSNVVGRGCESWVWVWVIVVGKKNLPKRNTN